MKQERVSLVGLVFVLLAALAPALAAAQDSAPSIPPFAKVYSYDLIETDFELRQDSTIAVEERITFNFRGSFNAAWRNIHLDKISAITNIEVLDGATLRPLQFSSTRLDKLNQDNWGYYTTWQEAGQRNIEWYYSLTDTQHTWILRYVVHGAIEFNKNQDRFYWNVFTDFSEPVLKARATVQLPQPVPSNEVVAVAYTSSQGKILGQYNEGTGVASFSAENFTPQQAFTIDVGFPHGIIPASAFWQDWLTLFWGYVASVIIFILTIVIIVWRWYVTEKKPAGRGTIIPQYEPPQNLKPAMAEIICKERLTNKGLTATLIDLAIRGYIKIEEDAGKNWWEKIEGRHYILRRLKEYQDDSTLEGYERRYLDILLGQAEIFSTRQVKRSSDSEKMRLGQAIRDLREEVVKETETDTNAYETKPSREYWAYIIGAIIFFIFFGLTMVSIGLPNTLTKQLFIAVMAIALCGLIIWLFYKYEARLSKEGRILKEDWLGFKMFLETAHTYRLQNLTPETFENFLPYAIIFGIEKKWGAAFDNVFLPQPTWYAGAAGLSTMPVNNAGGFSASAFSASFSSSFTSAFASSGGGGGGAGGGGAGGGSGGGGGGAD